MNVASLIPQIVRFNLWDSPMTARNFCRDLSRHGHSGLGLIRPIPDPHRTQPQN